MIRIAINGAAGRMGSALINSIGDFDLELAHLYVRPTSAMIGSSSELTGCAFESSNQMEEHIKHKAFDVLIDFSPPASVLKSLSLCVAGGVPLVTGTTGFDDAGHTALKRAAGDIPLVVAPNMSIGINVCFELIKKTSQAIGDQADIEIVEIHHRHKKDAPSGTSLKMGSIIADEIGVTLKDKAVYDRHSHTQRGDKEIGFQTIRAGDAVGEHTAMFVLNGERIEITHRASSRNSFANGALCAAQWVCQQPPGIYDMHDVLMK